MKNEELTYLKYQKNGVDFNLENKTRGKYDIAPQSCEWKILLFTNAQKISCLIHNDNGKFEACDSIFFIFADNQMEMKFLFKGSLISEGYLL